MKKLISVLLVSAFLLALTACQSSDGEDIQDPHFTGKVLEKYETTCLMEITDVGNQGFSVGEKIVVNTSIKDCPKYGEGDHLTVAFDGTLALSYPAQVIRVYAIYKTDARGPRA